MLAFLHRHGVSLVHRPTDADDLIQSDQIAGQRFLLPNPAVDDPEIPHQIPIDIGVTPTDLSDFGRGGSFAVTFFGPESLSPDKIQNEDFALAGTIETTDGPLSFGIIADGVTSKTFWAARGARIAAFAAYETIKEFSVIKNWQPSQSNSAEIDPVLDELCVRLDKRFREDREKLIKAHLTPPNWHAAVFGEHSDKLTLWYQTTLLIAVIGRRGGWFVHCGDGGAVRAFVKESRIDDLKVALASPDSVELAIAVSIGVTKSAFTRIFLKPAIATGQSVHMVLSSDGVDRSLKNKYGESDVGNSYAALDLSSAATAQATIEAMACWPNADRDNMSLAHVCFPPGTRWPHPDAAFASTAMKVDPGNPPMTAPQPGHLSEKPDGSLRSLFGASTMALRYLSSKANRPFGSRAVIVSAMLICVLLGAAGALLAVAAGPGKVIVVFLQSLSKPTANRTQQNADRQVLRGRPPHRTGDKSSGTQTAPDVPAVGSEPTVPSDVNSTIGGKRATPLGNAAPSGGATVRDPADPGSPPRKEVNPNGPRTVKDGVNSGVTVGPIEPIEAIKSNDSRVAARANPVTYLCEPDEIDDYSGLSDKCGDEP
jgi:hypothetical protein